MDPFSLPPVMLPLLINALALLITLLYGCREDIRERAVPVVMWYPAVAIGIPMLIWFWYSVLTSGDLPFLMPLIPLDALFCHRILPLYKVSSHGNGRHQALS
jgi:hypothetical protein